MSTLRMNELSAKVLFLSEQVEELNQLTKIKDEQIEQLKLRIEELSLKKDSEPSLSNELSIKETQEFFAKLEEQESDELNSENIHLPEFTEESFENQPVQISKEECSVKLQRLGTLFKETIEAPQPEKLPFVTKYNNIKLVIEYVRYGSIQKNLPDFSSFEGLDGHFVIILSPKMQINGIVVRSSETEFEEIYMKAERDVQVKDIKQCFKIIKTGRIRLERVTSQFADGIDAVTLL